MRSEHSNLSIYGSIIHSKRLLVAQSPKFRAAFDVVKIRLQSREQRVKTEGNMRTDQGTSTNEEVDVS